MQLGAGRPLHAAHVVAGGQRLGTQVARHAEQVGEFRPLVAAHAGHRRLARGIRPGKIVDHSGAETGLGVDDVMRDAKPVGHVTRVVYVLPGTACALAGGGGTMVVELQGDTNDLVPGFVQQAGDDAAVHAAGHGYDYAHGVLGAFGLGQASKQFFFEKKNQKLLFPRIWCSLVLQQTPKLLGRRREQKFFGSVFPKKNRFLPQCPFQKMAWRVGWRFFRAPERR